MFLAMPLAVLPFLAAELNAGWSPGLMDALTYDVRTNEHAVRLRDRRTAAAPSRAEA